MESMVNYGGLIGCKMHVVNQKLSYYCHRQDLAIMRSRGSGGSYKGSVH